MAILDITQYSDVLEGICQFTGNPKKDVGYLCSDSCPYFKFGSYYTLLHPVRATQAYSVKVYTRVADYTYPDGSVGPYMQYVGTGSQTGATLTYNGGTYTCSNNQYEDIRLHKINKWSKVKPILATGDADIDFDSDLKHNTLSPGRENFSYFFGLQMPRYVSDLEDEENVYAYNGLPSIDNTETDYKARLYDFQGYNPDAICTLSIEASHTYAQVVLSGNPNHNCNVTVKHPATPEGSINFDNIIQNMQTGTEAVVPIASRYPVAVVKARIRTLAIGGTTPTDSYKWFIVPMYTSWANQTTAVMGTATSKTYAVDIDYLDDYVRSKYGGMLPNNYKMAVWLTTSANPDNVSLDSLCLPPLTTVQWRDELFDFFFDTATVTYTRVSSTTTSGVYVYNVTVMFRFSVFGTTTSGYTYQIRFKRTSQSTYTSQTVSPTAGTKCSTSVQYFQQTSYSPFYTTYDYLVVATKGSGLSAKSYTLCQGQVTIGTSGPTWSSGGGFPTNPDININPEIPID